MATHHRPVGVHGGGIASNGWQNGKSTVLNSDIAVPGSMKLPGVRRGHVGSRLQMEFPALDRGRPRSGRICLAPIGQASGMWLGPTDRRALRFLRMALASWDFNVSASSREIKPAIPVKSLSSGCPVPRSRSELRDPRWGRILRLPQSTGPAVAVLRP